MAVSTPKSGYDTWVNEADPNTPHPSSPSLRVNSLAGSRRYGFLWMPLPRRIAGTTIVACPLTVHAHGALAAQTFTFQATSSRWDASKITYAHQPGVVGPTATITIPALADGQSFTVDLASVVQPVADGTRDNLGWRITTDATTTQQLEAFDGPGLSWSLQVTYSEPPEVPTDLHPNGTTVGVPKPIVALDFTDLGDDDPAIGWIQVQVDLTGDGVPDDDSGQVPTVAPTFDLSLLGFATPTSGQTVRWRGQVWDEDSNPSGFSSWASYTYVPVPAPVIDSPALGVLYDPTTDVFAHIPVGPTSLDAYRLWVLDGVDPTNVRYDSKKEPATDPTDIVVTLPLRNKAGGRVFHDDHSYVIRIRTFDDADREATPGTPAYGQVETTVVFNDDIALARPISYQVNQIDDTPFVKHTWTDAAAADAYVISRDGSQVARLTSADVIAGTSAYSWVETDSAPYVDHVYELRRLTAGTGRSRPLRASVFVEAPGVWLIRDNGDYVCLLGDPPSSASMKDRRSIYKPIGSAADLDILTGYEGLSDDSFDHWIEDHYPMPGGLTVSDTLDVLAAIKRAPRDPVQLVFGTFSKPVRIRNLSWTPHNEYAGRRTSKHSVTFGVTQSGDFDYGPPA